LVAGGGNVTTGLLGIMKAEAGEWQKATTPSPKMQFFQRHFIIGRPSVFSVRSNSQDRSQNGSAIGPQNAHDSLSCQ
jgi:hypothetical protein